MTTHLPAVTLSHKSVACVERGRFKTVGSEESDFAAALQNVAPDPGDGADPVQGDETEPGDQIDDTSTKQDPTYPCQTVLIWQRDAIQDIPVRCEETTPGNPSSCPPLNEPNTSEEAAELTLLGDCLAPDTSERLILSARQNEAGSSLDTDAERASISPMREPKLRHQKFMEQPDITMLEAKESGRSGDTLEPPAATSTSEIMLSPSGTISESARNQPLPFSLPSFTGQSPAHQLVARLAPLNTVLRVASPASLQTNLQGGEIKVLRLRLRPEALGDVDVTLRRDGTGTHVRISVAKDIAAISLHGDLAWLRERMGELFTSEHTPKITITVQVSDALPQAGSPLPRGDSEALGSGQGQTSSWSGERPTPRKQDAPPQRLTSENDKHDPQSRHGTTAIVV